MNQHRRARPTVVLCIPGVWPCGYNTGLKQTNDICPELSLIAFRKPLM